jgi:hypothetical protein
MKLEKYELVDLEYKDNNYPDLWREYHNFLLKYKNYDRIHLQAVELYDRHFSMFTDEFDTHPQSRLGMFIRACITAGYAKAKIENKTESEKE